MKNRQENYNGIDVAKFICAILVVMIHIAPFGNCLENNIYSYLNIGIQNYLGRIAVPFFFVSSGFFLYRNMTLNSFEIHSSMVYCKKILRLYLIWTIIYLPLSLRFLFQKDDVEIIIYHVLGFCRNCIFTGSFFHLWYLPATIFAVALVSLLLKMRVPLKIILLFAIVFYLLGLLAQSWFGLIEPLRDGAPIIWNGLKLIKMVIVTTRNGLFEGFLFVGLGAVFAFEGCRFSKQKSLTGFIISMGLMFVEFFFVTYFQMAREYDMYLFLVPATYFAFSFASQVELPDSPIYRKLRNLSSLIFFTHIWIKNFVTKLLEVISEPLLNTGLCFLITLAFTIIGGLIVIKLSERR